MEGILAYNNYIINIDNNYSSRKRNDISKYVNKKLDNHVIDIEG
jgi:hypothetical protein